MDDALAAGGLGRLSGAPREAAKRAAAARHRHRQLLEAGSFGAGRRPGSMSTPTAASRVLHRHPVERPEPRDRLRARSSPSVLGMPLQRSRVIQGDTDVVPGGDGTGGCRSLRDRRLGAEGHARHALIEKAQTDRCRAARGRRRTTSNSRTARSASSAPIASVDASATVARAARMSRGAPLDRPCESFQPTTQHLPERLPYLRGRDRSRDRRDRDRRATPWSTMPARIINPMVVEGQVHGGVAQGIGQALMEHAV